MLNANFPCLVVNKLHPIYTHKHYVFKFLSELQEGSNRSREHQHLMTGQPMPILLLSMVLILQTGFRSSRMSVKYSVIQIVFFSTFEPHSRILNSSSQCCQPGQAALRYRCRTAPRALCNVLFFELHV